jgi:hypothetical protein
MRNSGENQTGASILMESFATPGKDLRIAAWNVRTMYGTGKTAQVISEMRISEMRWADFDTMTLNSGETMGYSGRPDGIHQEEVGLIMNKEAKKSLQG